VNALAKLTYRIDIHPDYIQYEVEKLWELERKLAYLEEEVVHPHLVDTAHEIADAYKSYVRKVTGALHSEVRVEDSKPVRVVSAAPHAIYVELGTEPHVIEPKNAKALRFEIDGKVVFARRVFHPGTEAQYAMRAAYQDNMPKAIVELDEKVEAYLREVEERIGMFI